tara:strand:- start:47 stop:799 length:753 start_codon:yes stop_codon:yes gene_type:complete
MGIAEAVERLSQDRERVEVCDAGSGAIPIFAIYAALISSKVNATCLEVHKDSTDIAKSLVHAMGLGDRITIEQADATTFVPDRYYDLLVSETIGNALTREPIVQIMDNLVPYVESDGIILPSHILVKAALISVDDFFSAGKRYEHFNGATSHYYDPQWHTVASFKPGDKLDTVSFSFANPADEATDYLGLLSSEISIGNQHLGLYDSTITTPRPIKESDSQFKVFKHGPEIIRVEYKPGMREIDISCSLT